MVAADDAEALRAVAVDAKPDQLSEGLAELHPPEALDEQLPLADFVVMTVPHTPPRRGSWTGPGWPG